MNIDWFTFIAQIINFLILVALLRWLLYGPIVRAMKKREETISNQLEEAERKVREADEKAEDYQSKISEIDAKREEVLKAARLKAEEERRKRLKEARREVDDQRKEWQRSYRRELEDMVSDLRRQAGKVSLKATRQTLAELADADLQERMCAVLVSRLEKLDDDQRQELTHSLRQGEGGDVLVRSSFELSSDCRQRLHEVLSQRFDLQGEIDWTHSPDLICGLEIDLGGYTLGWNIEEFLQELNNEFGQHLEESEPVQKSS